jgi:membrane protease YdiL (CAAX protease family)
MRVWKATSSLLNPSMKKVALILYSSVVLMIVASFLLVLLIGYGFFFFTLGGLTLSMRSISFPVLVMFLVGFSTPLLRVGIVFSLIWMIFAVCFLAAWRWRDSFHGVFRRSVSGDSRGILNNFLFAMPLISSMSLTAALAIIYSQSSVGIETGEVRLPSNVHEAFLDLAYAPIYEEFAFRLVPIGLMMVFYVFLAAKSTDALSSAGNRLRMFFLAFIYPEEAKRASGLPTVRKHGIWKGLSLLEWTVIIVTSAIFGLAHVLPPGGGWEVGKITSAFVQGLFFAVTYVAYGFEAPILLHWYFNYYFFFFDPAIAENFFPGAVDLLSVVEVMILVLGVVGWAVFASIGLRRLRQSRMRQMDQLVPFPSGSPL